MSFWTNLKSAFAIDKELGAFNANMNDGTEGKLPVHTEWFFSARLGQPRKIDFNEIRTFGRSPWVQMVLNTIKKEITTIETNIVNSDDKDEGSYDAEKKLVSEFFDNINTEDETLLDLCSQTITDVGEIDAGVWVKVYSLDSYEEREVEQVNERGAVVGKTMDMFLKPLGQRTLLQVRPADGATFLKQIDVYRRLMAYFQYSFKNPRSSPRRFEKDEVVYMMMNKRPYSIYGFSPIQSVQQILQILIQATRWNKDYFKNNAIPEGIIGLPGANKESMEKFARYWQKSVKGKPHKLIYHNTDAKFTSFSISAKDMEFLGGMKWYYHLIFAQYGLSPIEVGFYENVNQGNQAGQERVSVRNALKPYMSMLEHAVNTCLIPEILQMENPPIKWQFEPADHAQEQIEFEHNMVEIEKETLTVNEYRKLRGRDPVEWGDEPKAPPQPMGIAPNNDDDVDPKEESKPKPKDENPKPNQKSLEIEAGEDIIEEAKDYGDFYEKVVDKWERKTLAALKDIPLNKMYDPEAIKTFGEFVSNMMNGITVNPFMGKIRKFIKESLVAGMRSAEEELDVDIGFTSGFGDKLKALEKQQLDGYMLPDGKQWHGIKGATKELQLKILKSVESDVQNKATRTEMTDNIKDIFEGSTTAQAKMIARTETTRFVNEGKLTAYKESGVDGLKAWASVIDDRTSDIDKRLHAKYFDKGIPLDDPFIDDVTGKNFHYPPSHPNCFLKGTKITTNKGKKNIEEIKTGDVVLTHKHRYKKVLRTMKSETNNYYELKVGTGKNQRLLKVTGNHPLLTTSGWKEVKNISCNDKVLFYDS